MGYRRQALRKKVIIRSENIKKRLRWAKERLNWAPEMWNNFIFSDECSVVIGGDRRIYCWRTEDEGDRPKKGRTQRRLSVMIWGAITINGVGIKSILTQRNIAKSFKTVFFLYWTGFTQKGTIFLCMTMHQSIHVRKRGNVSKIAKIMYLNDLPSHQI